LYAGVDIGRVTDASEIVVVMESLGGLKVVCIKSMVHEDFDKQEAAVMDCVRIGGVAKLCVDATGIGRQFGERLGQAFPRVATSLHYTAPLKEEMARELKRALQQGRLTLPRHRSLMEQLHAVRRTRTESGIARFDAPAAGSNHADKFWALAMAVNAAWSTGPVVTARSLR
jgi:phage FluMu gp28-like protein